MVVTPKQLADENSAIYLNEISHLESQIDAGCTQNYTGVRGSKLPMLTLDEEPRKIVQNKIIEKYKDAGGIVSFESIEDAPIILIREGTNLC